MQRGYPIKPEVLWEKYHNPDLLMGVSFRSKTHYCLEDIDRGGDNHPLTNINKFEDILQRNKEIGLHGHVLVQSSHSGGLHVFYPTPEEVSSIRLACAIKQTAESAGYPVKNGQLETFPNVKRYVKNPQHRLEIPAYQAHRLPLQPDSGSYILDDNLNPISDSLEDFLYMMEAAAALQDMARLASVMEHAYEIQKKSLYSTKRIEEFKEELEKIIATGWTDYHQTNWLLKDVGAYCRIFKRLSGMELTVAMYEIAIRMPGYLEFCRHRFGGEDFPDIWRRCVEWTPSIEKFYWRLGDPPSREGSFKDMMRKGCKKNPTNAERSRATQNMIKEAFGYVCETMEQIPTVIKTLKGMMLDYIKQKYDKRPSDRSFVRYKENWHPDYWNVETEDQIIDVEAIQVEEIEQASSHSPETGNPGSHRASSPGINSGSPAPRQPRCGAHQPFIFKILLEVMHLGLPDSAFSLVSPSSPCRSPSPSNASTGRRSCRTSSRHSSVPSYYQ